MRHGDKASFPEPDYPNFSANFIVMAALEGMRSGSFCLRLSSSPPIQQRSLGTLLQILALSHSLAFSFIGRESCKSRQSKRHYNICCIRRSSYVKVKLNRPFVNRRA